MNTIFDQNLLYLFFKKLTVDFLEKWSLENWPNSVDLELIQIQYDFKEL